MSDLKPDRVTIYNGQITYIGLDLPGESMDFAYEGRPFSGEYIRADLYEAEKECAKRNERIAFDTLADLQKGSDKLRAEVARLRTALRLAADEPNIDKARAIADEALEARYE